MLEHDPHEDQLAQKCEASNCGRTRARGKQLRILARGFLFSAHRPFAVISVTPSPYRMVQIGNTALNHSVPGIGRAIMTEVAVANFSDRIEAR
jgi:hypothetical protein